jgi:signal transduction histidine kinase
MRYRLEPRFAASDITLQWDVDLIEPLPQLDADAMRQLQFMLFEALSNVLQHSQASAIQIRAVDSPQGVRLSIADNGRGFDAASPARSRLSSMEARAAAIGARVSVQSAPGKTLVEIAIPKQGRGESAPD